MIEFSSLLPTPRVGDIVKNQRKQIKTPKQRRRRRRRGEKREEEKFFICNIIL
jgi:hypothetical protein